MNKVVTLKQQKKRLFFGTSNRYKLIPLFFLGLSFVNISTSVADEIAKTVTLRYPWAAGPTYSFNSFEEAKDALDIVAPLAIPYPIPSSSGPWHVAKYYDVVVGYAYTGISSLYSNQYVYSGVSLEETVANTISLTHRACVDYPHNNGQINSIEFTSGYRVLTHDYTIKVGLSQTGICDGTTYRYRSGTHLDRIAAKYLRYTIYNNCPSDYRINSDTTDCIGFSAQEGFQDQICDDNEANPCSPATGNKVQTFVDYHSPRTQGIKFQRLYLSQNNNSNQFTPGWVHNYQSVMNAVMPSHPVLNTAGVNESGLQQSSHHPTLEKACLDGWLEIKEKAYRGLLTSAEAEYAGGGICHIKQNDKIVASLTLHASESVSPETAPVIPIHRITRNDGRQYFFQLESSGEWKDGQHPEASLVAQGNQWLFTDAGDNQELYDEQGRLIQTKNRQGHTTFLQYNLTTTEGGDDKPETLDKVTDAFNRSLTFNYDSLSEQLVSVNTPDGLIQYSYDDLKNLSQVIYPDGKTETYHYEKTAFPHHLTGLTDENSNRFATWDYDDQGRAILSEHAGQADKVTFAYNSDGTTTVTGALGDSRTYHFDLIQGGLKVKKITGDRCQTCGNGHMKERTYDDNGYLSSYTDWNGNLTTYTRDATGLELSRTEASGTPQARTITTDWHADFRLPIKITQSGKVTEYTYDAIGYLLSQTTRNAQ
ncbi:MAG: DUF6531 domain-containing protein [Cocleimonas sp.]